jgi:hypothetical protein
VLKLFRKWKTSILGITVRANKKEIITKLSARIKIWEILQNNQLTKCYKIIIQLTKCYKIINRKVQAGGIGQYTRVTMGNTIQTSLVVTM